MKLITLAKKKWDKHTGNYPTFSVSPTVLLLFYIASTSVVSLSIGFLLGQVLPLYYQVVNELAFTSWGWQGWYVTTMIGVLAIVAWLAGNVAVRCNRIILERHFQ